MAKSSASVRTCLALAAVAGLVAACNGKPEDMGYTGGDTQAASPTKQTKSPLPPYPGWAQAMIGHRLSDVAKATSPCQGALDLVSTRHVGAHPGVELLGWGWDQQGKRPPAHVVFTDMNGTIVGAGDIDRQRIDVPKAIPGVTTAQVGWTGQAGVVSGELNAIGLTSAGTSCVLGVTTL